MPISVNIFHCHIPIKIDFQMMRCLPFGIYLFTIRRRWGRRWRVRMFALFAQGCRLPSAGTPLQVELRLCSSPAPGSQIQHQYTAHSPILLPLQTHCLQLFAITEPWWLTHAEPSLPETYSRLTARLRAKWLATLHRPLHQRSLPTTIANPLLLLRSRYPRKTRDAICCKIDCKTSSIPSMRTAT